MPAGLKTINVAALPKMFTGASAAARNVVARLPASLKHTTTRTKRRYFPPLKTANAASLIERLPEPGEVYHMVIAAGDFALWAVVPAILQLSARRIETLTVATLGTNMQHSEELCRLFDVGRIGRVQMLVSNYFKCVDSDVFTFLHHQLIERGQRLAQCRVHAKIILAEMDDGRAFCVESSANLRSCKSIEQITLAHDAELCRYHRGWIEQLLITEALK